MRRKRSEPCSSLCICQEAVEGGVHSWDDDDDDDGEGNNISPSVTNSLKCSSKKSNNMLLQHIYALLMAQAIKLIKVAQCSIY